LSACFQRMDESLESIGMYVGASGKCEAGTIEETKNLPLALSDVARGRSQVVGGPGKR